MGRGELTPLRFDRERLLAGLACVQCGGEWWAGFEADWVTVDSDGLMLAERPRPGGRVVGPSAPTLFGVNIWPKGAIPTGLSVAVRRCYLGTGRAAVTVTDAQGGRLIDRASLAPARSVVVHPPSLEPPYPLNAWVEWCQPR